MGNMSHDFFKAYPFRFCGYGFGMAEALRGPGTPALVRGLYTMATGFVLARTLYKPFQVSTKTQSPVKIMLWTVDTLVYEMLASAAIPVFTASLIKSVVSTGLQAKPFAGSSRQWAPALVSLMSLPFIIPFTDAVLDKVMNETIRQVYS